MISFLISSHLIDSIKALSTSNIFSKVLSLKNYIKVENINWFLSHYNSLQFVSYYYFYQNK